MSPTQKVVIGATLLLGAGLVAILVLRETVKPAWLVAPESASAAAGPSFVPALPPATPFEPPPAPSAPATSLASAEPSSTPEAGPAAAASTPPSASASAAARPPPLRPAPTRDIVELPDDFQYHPSGSGNLTVPAH